MRLPDTITALGRTWTIAPHTRDNPHNHVTGERIQHALDHWVARGLQADGHRVYYGFVPGLTTLLLVVTVEEAAVIVTAYPRERATEAWKDKDSGWFTRFHPGGWEIR